MNRGLDNIPSEREEHADRTSQTSAGNFNMHQEWLLRLACWAAILAIGIVSLMPGQLRPGTGISGHAEHLIAYFGAALAFGLGARELGQVGWIGLLLVGYAGVLETVQRWIPGRHAKLSDFVTSTTEIVIGCFVIAVFILLTHRRRESLYTRLLRIVCRRTWTSRDE
jgi:hypothetical protein